MSKEMLIIVLGVLVVVLTQLGIPYRPWGAIFFALCGVAVAVLGFLMRGEALGRGAGEPRGRADSHQPNTPEHSNGINSLN